MALFKNAREWTAVLCLFSFSFVFAETEGTSESATAVPLVEEEDQKEMLLQVKAKKHRIQNSAAVSRTEVNQEQIRQLPQGSEISLPKLLTSTTPGVVPGPFGQMFFRGNHANVQYQIDGVQLPESPSNTFGQAFSPRNIDQMEVITGGFAAEYGWRLSAVVSILTKEGKETPGGEVELNYGTYNTISPHLLYGGSNESGNLKYFLSLNYFNTDRGIDTPNPESTSDEGQMQGGKESVHNHANGDSEFARVDWQANNQDRISFLAFHSYNRIEIPTYPSSFSPNDPYFSQQGYIDAFGNQGEDHGGHSHTTFNYTPSNTNDVQLETSVFAQTVWKHTFTPRSFLQVAPYYKYSQITVVNDAANDLYTAPWGPRPIVGASPSSFSMNRHINNLGIKTDYSFRVDEDHLMKAGFQGQGSRTDGGFTVTGVDESTQGPKVISDSSPSTGYFEGIYIQDDFTLAKPLVLNLGLRYDATQFVFSDLRTHDSLLQPRVGLNYRVTETTKLHAFYGKLFQPAGVENLRYAFSLAGNTNATYDIKAEKDDYFEVGVAQQFLDTQVAQVNVYYKDAENMLDDAQLLNTSIAQPFNFEKGYAYGVEFSVRGKITEDWSEFANYSYSIAKGKGISGGIWAVDADEISSSYLYLDHVQLHTANAGMTYSKNSFWWTTQGLYGSGLRTGRDKSIGLPDHFTMDTTVGYEFHGDHWLSQFRLSGDILNLFDNRYPITIANGFNGSHYAAGRQFFIRLAKNL